MIFALLALAAFNGAHAADVDNGKRVFDLWCVDCHGSAPGHFGMPPAGLIVLQRRYNGAEPAELSKRTDLAPALIRTLVRQGLNIMPRTRKTEITDAQLDDVVAYLTRNNPPAGGSH
jgi:mono/diheme cytochrome c family protein